MATTAQPQAAAPDPLDEAERERKRKLAESEAESAVAKRASERAAMFAALSPEAKREYSRMRMMGTLSAVLSMTAWGNALPPNLQRAIAGWCLTSDIDPLTEFDVFGEYPKFSIYVNADWCKRKLGEMRRAGVISDYWLEHIHADERLQVMMSNGDLPDDIRQRATDMWWDKFFKRVEHNVPEQAEAACVAHITLPGGGHVIKGMKFGGNETSVFQPTGRGEGKPNPVYENNAALSVESGAIRRAMIQFAAVSPNWALSLESADAVGTRVADEIQKHAEQEAAERAARADVAADKAQGQADMVERVNVEYGIDAPRQLTEGAAPDPFIQRIAMRKADPAADDPYELEHVETRGERGARNLGRLERALEMPAVTAPVETPAAARRQLRDLLAPEGDV